tara:strand:+ start:57 stop:530 length:474 start_codon:yes stop_codon:yes gene_type:complete
MAHFAKITETNEVLAVLRLNNGDMLNVDGVEDETVGQQFLENSQSWPAHLWVQTSYNTLSSTHSSGDNSKAFRGNYAGKGYTWDEDDQIFWPQKPYTSWVKYNAEARWQSPIGDAPELTAEQEAQNTTVDENTLATHKWYYAWNEETTTWDLTNNLA